MPHSYALAVYNAQLWLEAGVELLLDELADNHRHFELLLIDDGSLDETIQIARALARRYPQITSIRRDWRFGPEAAAQLALRQASGDQVTLIRPEEPESGRIHFHRFDLGRPQLTGFSAKYVPASGFETDRERVS